MSIVIRIFLLIVLLLDLSTGFSQNNSIPRDTSFTIRSTLVKEKKFRPYIEVAAPKMAEDILYRQDVVYRTINGRQILLDIFYPEKPVSVSQLYY